MIVPYILIFVGLVAVAVLWFLPSRQLRWVRPHLAKPEISLNDFLKAENDRRVALAQIIGGLLVLGTLFYTNKTARLTESGQMTDRITKAVEALGKKDETVANLGGIHQISMIADSWEEQRFAMLQILSTFVEKDAALPGPTSIPACTASRLPEDYALPKPTTQAVVAVIGEQMPKLPDGSATLQINHVSLSSVDFLEKRYGLIQLAGDDLTQAHLNGSAFGAGSFFSTSLFISANLTDAHFERTRMDHVCMARAQLTNAHFSGADLEYASFRGVEDLKGTDFTNANLTLADMRGVDMHEAKGLSADQLKTIRCDERTVFPDGMSTVRDALKCAEIPEALN